MKRKILGGLAAAAMLAGGLAFTAGAAHAVQTEPSGDACYEERPTYGDIIEKETRERTRTENADTWQNFSPNRESKPFEGPPSWPTDERGTWQHENKPIPPGHQGPDGVYQKGQGNGSWFYRADGGFSEWTDWTEWTDWPGAGPVNDDNRDRGPAPHVKYTDTFQREYRYVVVGQYQTGVEQVEVPCPPPPPSSQLGLTYNQDCAPDNTNTWRIRPVDVNAAVAWELRYVGGATVASGTMNPGDGEQIVETTPRESVTAKLFFDSDANGSLDASTTKAGGSVLTDPALYEPGAKCGPEIPEQPEPEVEIVEIVDCEAKAVRIIITTTEYVYDKATNSWVLGEPTVEEKTRVLNDEEIAECTPPTTQPPTTQPPTTEPPPTIPPVTTQPPPPVTAPPTVPPTVPPSGELPATGSTTNTILGLAAFLTLSGLVLFGVRRKPVL